MHPSSQLDQGLVEMWLDIESEQVTRKDAAAKKKSNEYRVWDIRPQPAEEFEVRVCVFGCKNVPNMDVEGTIDAYVIGFIDEDQKLETDCHYRCTTHSPNFNYRLKFKE